MSLVDPDRSGPIIGCCLRLHRTLGPGFLESVYEAALAIELEKSGITFERQKGIQIVYEGFVVGSHRLDYLVQPGVVVELKACSGITEAHLSTARSYLKATGLRLALVINFAKPVLEIRRVIQT